MCTKILCVPIELNLIEEDFIKDKLLLLYFLMNNFQFKKNLILKILFCIQT